MDTFTSKENIDLLWEILLEEPILKNISNGKQKLIYNALYTNISSFLDKEKHKLLDLVTLNKIFLGEMIKIIRNKSGMIETENIQFKIEDIHAERKNIFEKDLEKRKQEFETSIILKPPIPDFTEKIEDEKIKGMEELIAKTVAQRNFDISQINVNINAEDWLKPQETSNKVHTIKIEEKVNNEVIELSTIPSRKKISWSKDNDIKYFDSNGSEEIPILNKLKKINYPLTQLTKDYIFFKEKMENMDKKMENMDKKINETALSLDKIVRLLNNIKNKNNLKI
jgi:hypothetical protein